VTEQQLTALGITTPTELAAVGAVDAWRQLRAAYPSVNRICLYALAGALEGIDWRDLPAVVMDQLRAVNER
jgi:hypothetical protein